MNPAIGLPPKELTVETNSVTATQENLSRRVEILTAELDLSNRRVNALIGELKLHLDRGNQFAEEAIRRRNQYQRDLQWLAAERATERAWYRKGAIIQFLFGMVGWVGFIGLVAMTLMKH